MQTEMLGRRQATPLSIVIAVVVLFTVLLVLYRLLLSDRPGNIKAISYTVLAEDSTGTTVYSEVYQVTIVGGRTTIRYFDGRMTSLDDASLLRTTILREDQELPQDEQQKAEG